MEDKREVFWKICEIALQKAKPLSIYRLGKEHSAQLILQKSLENDAFPHGKQFLFSPFNKTDAFPFVRIHADMFLSEREVSHHDIKTVEAWESGRLMLSK